jgi:RNA polymerase sigma-70 factor (ECF subfamily)
LKECKIREPMSIPPRDAISRFPFSGAVAAAVSRKPSEIEREVIHLFDQFRIPLLRYTLALGLPVDDGEEVVQEVFLALFRHLSLGKSGQNLRGWIFCVAHNLALKQRQCNHRSRGDRAPDETSADSQADPSPNPEDQAVATQRRRRMLNIVHALPEQDQCCLRLRAEGLRYREIARVLGISLGGVSLSLSRSLARLMRADEV